MEFNRRNSFNSENIFLFLFPGVSFLFGLSSFWIVCFAIPSTKCNWRSPKLYFLLCGILMHGRRHQAMSLPEKLLHFLAVFIAFLSLKTKFIFNAPPYASAKAFYLYLLHDTNKKYFFVVEREANEKWRKFPPSKENTKRVENLQCNFAEYFINSRYAACHLLEMSWNLLGNVNVKLDIYWKC